MYSKTVLGSVRKLDYPNKNGTSLLLFFLIYSKFFQYYIFAGFNGFIYFLNGTKNNHVLKKTIR